MSDCEVGLVVEWCKREEVSLVGGWRIGLGCHGEEVAPTSEGRSGCCRALSKGGTQRETSIREIRGTPPPTLSLRKL